MTGLLSIVEELNRLAPAHKIGKLSAIRRRLPGRRRPSDELFPLKTVNKDAPLAEQRAFHYGGRTELQFNVGFELIGGTLYFRHGVAFSLETSRFFHEADIRRSLLPKILRYDDYVRCCGADFEDMRMWCWSKKGGPSRVPEMRVASFPAEWCDVGHFIFIGKLQTPDRIEPELMLTDLDRLLPLYEFVEGKETIGGTLVTEDPGYRWRSGHNKAKRRIASAVWTKGTVEIDLKHNGLQDRLFEHLAALHGKDNVGTELTAGNRKRIDLAVRSPAGTVLYEIKTSSCVESCIREALAQLIEYSYWVRRAGETVRELVVVSENRLTPAATAYLEYLRTELKLPLTYRRIDEEGNLRDDLAGREGG
jgi:hypothetical protein